MTYLKSTNLKKVILILNTFKDLEFGGLSDPKARDEKLEIPKKLCSNEPDLRQSSMKLEPRESKTEGQRVLRKGFLDENERIDIKEMLKEPNGFLRKGD
ncbi:hypothetical protein DFH28DRAFT_973889 [Melampsora americana]|nr:hypothetical protein DFH28DRAFT_973889 [Melampsora americana]